MNLKKIFQRTELTLALGIIAPIMFFWSNNSHMFSIGVMCRMIPVLAVFSCLIAVIFYFAGYFIIKLFKEKNLEYSVKIINIIISSCFFALFMRVSLGTYMLGIYKYIFLFIIITVFIIFLLKNKIYILNFFLSFIIISSFILTTSELIFRKNEPLALFDVNIEFKDKPNVYVFVLESYHSLNLLKKFYNIDVLPFKNFLQDNEFIVYDNNFSNSSSTLLSMSDLFGMRDFSAYEIYGARDALPEIRGILGGGPGNFVFKTFKDNGYFTEAFYRSPSYYMQQKGAYLDKSSWDFWSSLSMLNWRFEYLRQYFKYPELRGCEIPENVDSPYLSVLADKFISEGIIHKPYFAVIKGGATHYYGDASAQEWIKSGIYQFAFAWSQKELIPCLGKIIDADPSAIVILIGDHGSLVTNSLISGIRYTWADYLTSIPPRKSISNMSEIEDILRKNGFSPKEYVEDKFGTFLAIRAPGYGNIAHNLAMDHRNLFWHVFAALSNDQSLLLHRGPSITRMGDYTVIKDGKIQDNWLLD